MLQMKTIQPHKHVAGKGRDFLIFQITVGILLRYYTKTWNVVFLKLNCNMEFKAKSINTLFSATLKVTGLPLLFEWLLYSHPWFLKTLYWSSGNFWFIEVCSLPMLTHFMTHIFKKSYSLIPLPTSLEKSFIEKLSRAWWQIRDFQNSNFLESSNYVICNKCYQLFSLNW